MCRRKNNPARHECNILAGCASGGLINDVGKYRRKSCLSSESQQMPSDMPRPVGQDSSAGPVSWLPVNARSLTGGTTLPPKSRLHRTVHQFVVPKQNIGWESRPRAVQCRGVELGGGNGRFSIKTMNEYERRSEAGLLSGRFCQ